MERISAESRHESAIGVASLDKKPFFSIIIPVYNVAPYLRECLDSVLAQTFADWEAICVDDGSTDGSGEILDEYGARDKRFRVLHQGNAGVSAARNRGLEEAKGEWMWFVDADDALCLCALKDIKDAVFIHPEANSVHIGYVDGATVPREWRQDEASQQMYFPSPCDDGLLRFLGGIGSIIIRRRAIGPIRFEPFPRGEDSVFLFACARNGFGCIELGKKLYFYRQRPGSATHIKVDREIVQKNFECQRRFIENLAESIRLLGNLKVPHSWSVLFNSCYRTYCDMYFQLDAHDRDRLIYEWIYNIDMFKEHYRPPFGIRVRIALIKFTRSGVLVRWLAFGRVRGLQWLMWVLRKLKGACP